MVYGLNEIHAHADFLSLALRHARHIIRRGWRALRGEGIGVRVGVA